MEKISVWVDNQLCFWVDTVIMFDEYYYACAVLIVVSNGSVFLREVSKIKVIDSDFIY